MKWSLETLQLLVTHVYQCSTQDGVAPSRMVGVSASVNLPLHHKVQKFSPGTGLPGWSQKKGRKMVAVVCSDLWLNKVLSQSLSQDLWQVIHLSTGQCLGTQST